MIDYSALQRAFDTDGIYALQLEIGDQCFQGCSYCYMNALEQPQNTLSDEQIRNVLLDARTLGITAIEWLGGEPLLRRTIFEHMALARDLGLRNNVWTGGLLLVGKRIRERVMDLTQVGLISVHVSSVNPVMYQRLHPQRTARDLYLILSAVEDILAAGYPPDQMLNSATFTGLQSAADMVETIDYFATRFGIKTSLNVYHTYLRPNAPPGALARFIPPPEAVERVYQALSAQWGGGSLPMNCVNKQYCSATVAVLCDGSVTPCATIREPEAPNIHREGSLLRIVENYRDHLLFTRLKTHANLPDSCRRCDLSDRCWGCRSRAYAAGYGVEGPDPRCFRSGQRQPEHLLEQAQESPHVHSY